MDKKLLLTLEDELHQKLSGEIWPRKVELPEVTNKIHVITGMRRVGKTFFLLQKIKELLASGVESSRILYLNFEDDRLLPMNQQQLSTLVDAFYQSHPENHDQLCYLVFDEIQNVDGWALLLRRLFDTKKTIILVTGSSAKMLSKEIATSLRGRSLNTEMWPLDFFEYPGRADFPLDMPKRIQDRFQAQFQEYMIKGGFPEVQFYDLSTRVRVLQDYVEVVIFRDIIERYQVSNIPLVKYLIRTILHSSGRQLSLNKLYNDLKSQGFRVGKNTLYEYLSYIEDCYLAFTVPLYSHSLRAVQSNPKKVYAIDTGLIRAFTLRTEDYGNLFENIVYLMLRKNGHRIYYYFTKERYEVDFLTVDPSGSRKLFQVCYDLKDEETLRRENRALDSAKKELEIPGELVTMENFLKFANSL